MKSGFPVKSNAIGPILAMDLLGDDSPELIHQDKFGIIQILDNEGNIISESKITDYTDYELDWIDK